MKLLWCRVEGLQLLAPEALRPLKPLPGMENTIEIVKLAHYGIRRCIYVYNTYQEFHASLVMPCTIHRALHTHVYA